jgi:hypothetical protein
MLETRPKTYDRISPVRVCLYEPPLFVEIKLDAIIIYSKLPRLTIVGRRSSDCITKEK